jgi:signal transduction histidine kinase
VPLGPEVDEKQRLADLGYLAEGIAREIGTPLTIIASCSEALEKSVVELPHHFPDRESSHGTAARCLKTIQEEVLRAKMIVQRVVEFSMPRRHRELVDVGQLVRTVIDVVKHLENHRTKQIIFEQDAELMTLLHPLEMKSVVLNLVVNALESMDDDGTLSIVMAHRNGMVDLCLRGHRLRDDPRCSGECLQALLHQKPHGQGNGPGPFHQSSHRQGT